MLDIGCGGGELARADHVVTGIDPAPGASAAARERVSGTRFVLDQPLRMWRMRPV